MTNPQKVDMKNLPLRLRITLILLLVLVLCASANSIIIGISRFSTRILWSLVVILALYALFERYRAKRAEKALNRYKDSHPA